MYDTLPDAAREYVALGLRVIALSGKQPNTALHPHGLYDALDAETPKEQFDTVFGHRLTTGVGILTAYPYFVIDIDGEEGARAWREIVGERDFIPDRWVAKTGRGLHVWYAHETRTSTRKLGPKLDLKGDGGYVAAPPSAHPDGGKYEWLLPPGGMPPIEPPQGLMQTLYDISWERARHEAPQARGRFGAPLKDGILYATQSVDGILKRMREAERGERNDILNWAAFRMAEGGANEDTFALLTVAAREAGLPEREIATTIRSAQKGFAHG